MGNGQLAIVSRETAKVKRKTSQRAISKRETVPRFKPVARLVQTDNRQWPVGNCH